MGGVPRSGTTLIHAVLCSTPATNPGIAEDRVLRHIALSHEECLAQFERHVQAVFPDREALRDFHREQATRYIAHLATVWPAARRLVVKQPMLTMNFPTLAELLPEARFVIVVRDPRAIVASLLEVDRKEVEGTGKPRFGGTVEAYIALMDAYWRPSLTHFSRTGSGRCAWLRYEDFVRAPRAAARRLGEAGGVDLRSYDPDHPWRGWSEGTTTREDRRDWPTFAALWGQPVEDSRIDAWRDSLTSEQAATIMRRLAPYVRHFGYGDST